MLLEIILAIIPIAWLIISMAGLKMAGYKSCGIGLVIAIVEGVAVYHMTVPEAITGTLEGVVSAVWPICVIIVGAMFLYNMSLRTGAMDVIKAMLASVSNDKRVGCSCYRLGLLQLHGRYRRFRYSRSYSCSDVSLHLDLIRLQLVLFV